ncbi:MAG TPA: spore coat associated protein CotJA [Clostridiales bacterium]|nr:spore coat associated protein CotJA [Clostridiales bacterium]
MSGNDLAISNIPIQPWGELYNEEEALNIGTIFHDLNKPFFAAEAAMGSKSSIASEAEDQAKPLAQAEREELITRINQIGFYLDDLTLYLDTHDKDAQAIQLYHEKSKEFAELRKQFAQQYYPLSRLCIPDCMNDNEAAFCWQEGPMPWEGACV